MEKFNEATEEIRNECQGLLMEIVRAIEDAARSGVVYQGDLEIIAERLPTVAMDAFTKGMNLISFELKRAKEEAEGK